MGHGPHMIFMGVGDQHPRQLVAALLDEGRVGGHHIDARIGRVAEGDAAIDDHPRTVMAVGVEIHTDLTRATEGHEEDFVGTGYHEHPLRNRFQAIPLRRAISRRPVRVKSGSVASIASITSANKGASPPVATTVTGFPYS